MGTFTLRTNPSTIITANKARASYQEANDHWYRKSLDIIMTSIRLRMYCHRDCLVFKKDLPNSPDILERLLNRLFMLGFNVDLTNLSRIVGDLDEFEEEYLIISW